MKPTIRQLIHLHATPLRLSRRVFYVKGKPTTEAELEKKTKKALEHNGFLTFKFTSPQKRGVPDDIILFPSGKVIFVEFKTPMLTGKLSFLQKTQVKLLSEYNFYTFIIDSVNAANELIDFCYKYEDDQLTEEDIDALIQRLNQATKTARKPTL